MKAMGVFEVVDRMRKGAILCESYDDKGKRIYWAEPGGRSVRGPSVHAMLQRKMIEPVGDGLFDGGTQTYRLTDAAACA